MATHTNNQPKKATAPKALSHQSRVNTPQQS